jgi:hypothetical protein
MLLGQTPDIRGVWKADLQKSKVAGPPIQSYVVLIERKTYTNPRTKETAPEIEETTGIRGEHGEGRSVLTFLENGKSFVRPYEGIPTRLVGSWDGRVLTVNGEVAGRPSTFKRTYELSGDGQTITLSIASTNNRKEQQITLVLLKQPDLAGEPLRQPEQIAAERFKNVKTSLKDLPASEFIDNMRYIAWSLNKDCEFCHVKGHFDSDDKKEKRTARKMIDMTASIDQTNFKGHPEVRCFTCHEQHPHPIAYPPFPDQTERAQGDHPEATDRAPASR